jgi:transcriptional regulator with PAS, ATPase and Fis domain
MIGGNAEGEMSFLVTDPVMQEYGVSKEELFSNAAGNMEYSIRPLFSVLAELEPDLADETIAPPDDMPMHSVHEVIQDDEDPEEQEFMEQEPEDMSIKAASLELIEKVLRKHGGNRKAAAAELGISERTLYRKIKQMTEK